MSGRSGSSGFGARGAGSRGPGSRGNFDLPSIPDNDDDVSVIGFILYHEATDDMYTFIL